MKLAAKLDSERVLPILIFVISGLVFLPVLDWLTRQTFAHEQLLNAFIVLVITVGLLVYEKHISLKPVFRFTDTVQLLLVVSYALLVLAIFTRLNLIILASLSLCLASLLLYLFGHEQKRLVWSSLVAFTLFAGIAVIMPLLDWPLRTLAGKWAAAGLQMLGQQVELGIYSAQEGPKLMLLNNGQPFHVAPECNGFGMVSSCLLMATIIVFFRRLSWFDRLLWLIVALVLGLFFNSLRIVVIILLAPHLPDSAYLTMHETVGIITTYGGLAALYFLLMPRLSKPDPVSAAGVPPAG